MKAEKIFISFEIENTKHGIKDKNTISNTIDELFPSKNELMETNYDYELIYSIDYPSSSNSDDYVIFWNKIESLLSSLSRFLPHFTNYAL